MRGNMVFYISLFFIVLTLLAINPVIFNNLTTKQELVFEYYMSDPVGDDKGYGNITYPTNSVFQPGVFDLIGFGITHIGSTLYLVFDLNNLGDNPWNGPNNFSLQYIQVYILTTNTSLPVANTTYGLNILVSPGWNYAVLITPGWDTNPVPEGQLPAIYDASGNLIAIEDHVNYDIYAVNNTIVVSINDNLLCDVDNYTDWNIVVAVAGYDGYASYKVRGVVAGSPTEWEFGGGDPDAINAGIQPLVIDLLAPTPNDQYSMLSSYNVSMGEMAVVRGIRVSEMNYVTTTLPITTTTTTTTTTPTGEIVFSMNDPVGDDKGPGTYTYPTNDVFQPGVFDLTGFKVVDQGDTVAFYIYVDNLGDNPWNGPNGFCLQYPQIYILADPNMPVNNTSFGAHVYIDPGWQIALLLAPGWDTAPVPEGQLAALYYYNGTVIPQGDGFKVYAIEDENAIVAVISKNLLINTENIMYWKFTVLLTSYDGYAPYKIRGVIAGNSTEWEFGGGDQDAINAGVEPLVIDLLAPTPSDQYQMLTSYNISTREYAHVEMYSNITTTTTSTTTTTTTTTTTVTTITTTTTTSTITTTTTSITTTTTTTTSPVKPPKKIFSISDPVGDDKGYSSLTYPTNNVFQPGVFDLTNFTVLGNESYITLEFTFRNLGDNPWKGPNGFSLQYIQVYILTTDKTLPVNHTTFGLNVVVGNGWNYAVLVVPGWTNVLAPVPRGQLSAIYSADGRVLGFEGRGDIIDAYIVDNNTIAVSISKSVLMDTGNINKWVFTVAVAGYDGYAPFRVRSVVAGESTEWNFGGGDPDAVNAGIQPLIIDLLAPTPSDQYRMLSSYNVGKGELATIYGVNASTGEIAYPPTTTSPTTTTTTTTATTTTTTSSPTTTTTITTKPSKTITTTTTTTSTTTTTTSSTTKPTIPTTTTGAARPYSGLVYVAYGSIIAGVVIAGIVLWKILAARKKS
jgi:carbohydrate-binding DOMON domain-containing protein